MFPREFFSSSRTFSLPEAPDTVDLMLICTHGCGLSLDPNGSQNGSKCMVVPFERAEVVGTKLVFSVLSEPDSVNESPHVALINAPRVAGICCRAVV